MARARTEQGGTMSDTPAVQPPTWRSPRAAVRNLLGVVGPIGVVPLLILLGLSAAERFDFTAYGVLGPEIRKAFDLNNSTYLAIAGAAGIIPLFFSVPIGFIADRGN